MNYLKKIASQDGTPLYTKVNESRDALVNVIIVHGLAEHLDRYDLLATHLNEAGYNVIRYDQRGHGRSGGKPIFYSRKEELTEDLDAIVEFVQTHYNGPTYLLGHSMGGLAVVLYGTQHAGKVDGIITSGALTRGHNGLPADIDDSYADEDYVPNKLQDGLCSTPDIAEKYQLDDFVATEISAGLIRVMAAGVAHLKANPQAFTDSILIMHGTQDGLVAAQDSIDLYNEIATSDKSLRLYSGLEHEILNEAAYKDLIHDDIITWIRNQSHSKTNGL